MDFSNIVDHPDRDDIISKLLTGTEPKDVVDWLKIKYPDKEQRHLLVSIKTLQQFNKSQYMDLYQQFQKDAKDTKEGHPDKKAKKAVASNMTYQKLLEDVATKEIDIHSAYLNMVKMAEYRIGQLFDNIQQNPQNVKIDYALMGWIKELGMTLEKLDRKMNNTPDQIIQHNHSVQYIEQNINVLQEAIRDVLQEMNPEFAFVFMEKFSARLSGLKAPTEPKPLSQEAKWQEVKALETRIAKKDDKFE